MENERKPKEVRKCKYTVEVIDYDDHTQRMSRVNDGFTATELLGILEFTQAEVIEMIKGRIKPDIIERKVIKPKK